MIQRKGKDSDNPSRSAHDADMASRKREAATAAWEGADLERPIEGEDPESASSRDAQRWIAVYRHLVNLEQELFDVMARLIPSMPADAQKEAETTNLPVIASQVERFRHRLDFWMRRRDELDLNLPKGGQPRPLRPRPDPRGRRSRP